jgi:hypothetical protein
MNKQEFHKIIDDLNTYKGVEVVVLLDSKGQIIFCSDESDLDKLEIKALFRAWKQRESSIIFQNQRYAILKNEDIQLAAKNTTGGKGNLAGSITNEGEYLLAHISKDTELTLLEWSIFINKLAWQTYEDTSEF